MGAIDRKIAATAFWAPTTLSFDDVSAAADKAAQSAGGVGISVKRIGDTNEGRIEYQIARLGAIAVGKLEVSYSSDEAGNRVSFCVPDYLVSPSSTFSIPLAPKESPALPVARSFAKRFRTSLSV